MTVDHEDVTTSRSQATRSRDAGPGCDYEDRSADQRKTCDKYAKERDGSLAHDLPSPDKGVAVSLGPSSVPQGLNRDRPPRIEVDNAGPGSVPTSSGTPTPERIATLSPMTRRKNVDGHVLGLGIQGRPDSPSTHDSGTEADDERHMRMTPPSTIADGLAAPPSTTKQHKGLRDARLSRHEAAPSPIPTPKFFKEAPRFTEEWAAAVLKEAEEEHLIALERFKRSRRAEALRRVGETALLALVGAFVLANRLDMIRNWSWELASHAFVVVSLVLLYPVRLLFWSDSSWKETFQTVTSLLLRPFSTLQSRLYIPSAFDPAPLLYPPFLPVFVSASLGLMPTTLAPNLILGLASVPSILIPFSSSSIHWFLTLLPVFVSEYPTLLQDPESDLRLPYALKLNAANSSSEVLSFLYPLHQCLLPTLYYLTTTSLLPTELHLLSISLINLLLHTVSPHLVILKSLLWVGGLSTFILCRHVCNWEATLAKIPRWRFRRAGNLIRARNSFLHALSLGISSGDTEPDVNDSPATPSRKVGRRKRRLSGSIKSYLSLTPEEAKTRRWIYAAYIYSAILFVIISEVRFYVAENALRGQDPISWALGYLFGQLEFIRSSVASSNLLERWVTLPSRPNGSCEHCGAGWVQHLRIDTFGAGNTRLALCAHHLLVLITGIAIVFRLSKTVEVDTRRKVFHGMMVAMFLPTTFIDPGFASLALCLVLAGFLLLEVLRASEVPPLAKPLAIFLTPYVDGRDLRGPVVVSHIFLLIGCAIPLWLSLTRAELDLSSGLLEVRPAVDVSPVAGVVCVGMGDAAASLVGRSYGCTKWPWSGGKSLEGSAAFAAAVTLGLLLARAWLFLGGWTTALSITDWIGVLARCIVAALGASLTEAVLTGGNDNVIVPVVLWLLVRGARI